MSFVLLVAALITLLMTSAFMKIVSGTEKELSYSEFIQEVESGYTEGQPNSVVESVQFGSDRIYIKYVEKEEAKNNPTPTPEAEMTVGGDNDEASNEGGGE